MLKFLGIFFWVTPGILLFLYLIWISKRRRSKRMSAGQTAPLPICDPEK